MKKMLEKTFREKKDSPDSERRDRLDRVRSEIVELQHATVPTLMFNHRSLYAKTRYSSLSTDMGLHWHGFGPVPSLPDPGCKGGIAAWPSHKALLFTNVRIGQLSLA